MSDEESAILGDEEQDALFEVKPDWADMWQGMPDYSHEDMMPWQTVMIHFKDQAARQRFAQLIGQPLHAKTKFLWYPKAEILKASDKVFTSGAKVSPKYPVYIISKGRWESRLTQRCMEWTQISYRICVEPQELEQYVAAGIPREKILVLPFSNLGQGGIPARNFVWNHSTEIGAERHWILDDNIDGFCRFQDNLKVEVDSGITFKAIEDFVDRYENVAMAGFNYDYFAPRKQGHKIKPITLNTRIYSGILIKNGLRAKADGEPIRWRGRYNEDTDLSIRVLKDGWCTVLFNAFLMYKRPTLTMKGGNTDQLYAGVNATSEEWAAHFPACKQGCNEESGAQCAVGRDILSKDGRWLMAESLRAQHPDCVRVSWKWDRWQHEVDYRAFKGNQLILREGVTIGDGAEYAMEIAAMPVEGMAPALQARAAKLASGVPPAERRTAPRAAAAVELPAAQQGPSVWELLGPTVEPAAQPVAAQPVAASEPAPAASVDFSITLPKPELLEPAGQSLPPSPGEFRSQLLARGHRLLTRGGKFFISESSRLTEADRAYVKANRDTLIALADPWLHADAPAERPHFVEALPGTSWASTYAPPVVHEQQSFVAPAQHVSLGAFLGEQRSAVDPNWKADEPPDLKGIDEVVLNFATDGVKWSKGHRPGGVTVSTMDGKLTRFLPFRFAGNNLNEEVVKRWAREQLRGKKIYNSNTRFDVHMAREWGVDLEEQNCTFSDVQHTAALLDDSRKRFAIDLLATDYFPDEAFALRVDESRHLTYLPSEVVEREYVTARLVGRLRDAMYPEIAKQGLGEIQHLEDGVIPVVVEMEKNGAPLDLALLEEFSAECVAKHDEIMWEVAREAGFAFDHTAKSWQRLFESLGLPPTDGNDEATLMAIDHPLVKKAYRGAQYASLNSKTFKAYREAVDADGVLRFDINQLRGEKGGTVSGRFSIGYVQQVPNHDNNHATFGIGEVDDCDQALCRLFPRRLFVPAPGALFFEADAAQIEYRLFAHYANNRDIIAAYKDDPWLSFHKMTWAKMKAYKPDMLYSHQKTFNFAKQYGARSIKLAVMMKFITEAEGDAIRKAKRWDDPRLTVIHEIEDAYSKMMPEGDQLLDQASHLAKSKCDEYCRQGDELHKKFEHRGYVKTLRGRRSRFPHNHKTYIGLNRVLQGTGADIMKLKLVELHRERKQTGFLMRLTVHDAVQGDVPSYESVKQIGEILNHQSYPELKVPIKWTTNAGKNWAACK